MLTVLVRPGSLLAPTYRGSAIDVNKNIVTPWISINSIGRMLGLYVNVEFYRSDARFVRERRNL